MKLETWGRYYSTTIKTSFIFHGHYRWPLKFNTFSYTFLNSSFTVISSKGNVLCRLLHLKNCDLKDNVLSRLVNLVTLILSISFYPNLKTALRTIENPSPETSADLGSSEKNGLTMTASQKGCHIQGQGKEKKGHKIRKNSDRSSRIDREAE